MRAAGRDHDAGRRARPTALLATRESRSSRSTAASPTSPCDAVVIDNERGGARRGGALSGSGTSAIALARRRDRVDERRGPPRRLPRRAAPRRASRSTSGSIVRIPLHAPDAPRADRRARSTTSGRPAIFAANNMLAEQAWQVLRGAGPAASRTTSRSSASTTSPGWRWSNRRSPSSTQPTLELGRCAAELLLRGSTGPTGAPGRRGAAAEPRRPRLDRSRQSTDGP